MFGFLNFPTIGHKSRAGKVDSYPYDLDASERITRPKTGIDKFPIPWNGNNFAKLGCVSGLMPQNNAWVWAQGYGKDPAGPIVSALPVNLQWQITIPGLNKQMPNNTSA
jgi:hypothetical protein